MQRKAIVAGAGIGGLATALALVQSGWSVTVLERAEALGEVGAGLQISPNGMKVLDRLGIVPAIEAQPVRAGGHRNTWRQIRQAASAPAA